MAVARGLLALLAAASLAFLTLGLASGIGDPSGVGTPESASLSATACAEVWAWEQDRANPSWSYRRPLLSPMLPPEEGSLCETWDDSRHAFEEIRSGWMRYTNERFGFSADVPAEWYRGCPPLNGDGLSFYSPDGLVSLTFYGFNNVQDGSNPLGLATLEEYVQRYRTNQAARVAVDGWEGIETVGPWPDPADPRNAGACADPRGIGCFTRRRITLLGLTEGRGIILTAPVPLFAEYTMLLDEILRSYRAGNLDG